MSDWLASQLGKYEAQYTTTPPKRTDDGENAPDLPLVYARRPASMRRQEMVDVLTKQWGLICWGCGFEPPTVDYLDLDHISPASEGGSNELDNRAILCGPCNRRKSNRMTLIALRNENRKMRRWHGQPTVDKKVNILMARKWASEYLVQRPQQGTLTAGAD